jgi:peptide chain release factor 2
MTQSNRKVSPWTNVSPLSPNESLTPWCAFDIPTLEQEASRIESDTQQPDFWSDNVAAQTAMRRLTQINQKVSTWRSFQQRVSDTIELAEIADAEPDEEISAHVLEETDAIERELAAVEFQLAFSGPYDARNAIFAIHAGAGGTESQDWAEMLLRMYLRWCENRGFETDVLDSTLGEEAGVKSVTVEVRGANAYGYLKSERGVHRLVRLSPFDSSHARHTSFALVEVMPEAEGAVEVDIKEEDLRIDIYHSAGHGGQNVQKVATAVRITHLPTGLVVTCQNERSQSRNKESALRVLEARLLEQELEKRAEEQARIKGEHVEAGWGNQIRSYVLHPYKMVKDHRTDYETSNAGAVLDGDLDGFIQAYLNTTMGSAA